MLKFQKKWKVYKTNGNKILYYMTNIFTQNKLNLIEY